MNFEFNKLLREFRRINSLGFVRSVNSYLNGIGMTFEKLLGKEEDNFSYPDYEGIEIKTQHVNSAYPITLFSCAPYGNYFPANEYLRKTYGFKDNDLPQNKKLCFECFYNKNVLSHNRYFCNLNFEKEDTVLRLKIYDINYKLVDDSVYWLISDIEEKLKIKLSKLAMVYAKKIYAENREFFKYFKIEFYKYEHLINFIDLVKNNVISVCFNTERVQDRTNGGYKNKTNCYFKINKFDLGKLFTLVYQENLYNNIHY